jgi:hypothetical protein
MCAETAGLVVPYGPGAHGMRVAIYGSGVLGFSSAWQVGSATKITAQRNEKQPCEFQERPSLEWRRR